MSRDNEIIFTCYSFGPDYREQQIRLRESIYKIYPNANLYFKHDPDYPSAKERFQQSLYGFKPRLIRKCLQKGFKKIIFFDPAITLNDKVDYWFELSKENGVVVPIDRQVLSNVTSDNCLAYMGLKREDVENINLVGGSLYIFDFNVPKCMEIFTLWEKMELDGMFGKQDDLSHDRLQGHRMDETCLALAMNKYGVKPFGHDEIRYAYEHPETKSIHGYKDDKPIVIKKHFK